MSHAWRAAILAAVIIVVVGGGVVLAVVLAVHYAISQDQVWCTALDIITRHPVNPPQPGHTAQADNYSFYQSILEVKHRFNCG